MFATFVAFLAVTIAFAGVIQSNNEIDMHTNLYYVPDLYMPVVRALEDKHLIDEAAKKFDKTTFMPVRLGEGFLMLT